MGFFMINWYKGNTFSSVVTFYPNNFTLNAHASTHFSKAPYCLIGIDKQDMLVVIKPVTEEQIKQEEIPQDHLHSIFIGKGYARISNKAILKEVSELLNISFDGVKYHAIFDKNMRMLLINLNQPK